MEQAATIWEELKRYINTVDRAEAAEAMVSILVDNDGDPEDIKQAFGTDKDIKNALTQYLSDDEEEYPEEEDDEEDDLDWEE